MFIGKKKVFTLLEMLIVILVIGLLLLAIRNIFSLQQGDLLKAQGCVANIVGNTENFFYSALTSKGLYTGGEIVYPEKYIIEYSGGNIQKVYFKYVSGGVIKQYKIFSFTGNGEDFKYGCYSENYHVDISGNLLIEMQPGLEGGSDKLGIIINNNLSIKTGEVYFRFYGYGYSGKVLGKLIIDKRVDLLHYVPCLVWTGRNYCLKYAQ